MKTSMAGVVAFAATIALTGCADMQSKMPDWMPGSGAISVKLTGAEEVPPVSTAAAGAEVFASPRTGPSAAA